MDFHYFSDLFGAALRSECRVLLIPFLDQYIALLITLFLLCSRWLKKCYKIKFFQYPFQAQFWQMVVIILSESLSWTEQRKISFLKRRFFYTNHGSTQKIKLFHRKKLLEKNFVSHDAPHLLSLCTLVVHNGN